MDRILDGGHVGYTRGSAHAELIDPLDNPGASDFTSSFGSLSGGVQIGYNRLFPSRIVLGVEADASFLNYLAADDGLARLTPTADVSQKIDYMATVRGRLGYAFPRWLIYATGGFAWSLGRFLENPGVADDIDKALHLYKGWAAGAGVEFAVAPSWTAKLGKRRNRTSPIRATTHRACSCAKRSSSEGSRRARRTVMANPPASGT